MSLDFFTSITEEAQKYHIPGIIMLHQDIIREFGGATGPHLNKVMVTVVKGVLDIENPAKPRDTQRVFYVPIYLTDRQGRAAGIELRLVERKIGPAPGARLVLVDWDGRVIEYQDFDKLEGGDVE